MPLGNAWAFPNVPFDGRSGPCERWLTRCAALSRIATTGPSRSTSRGCSIRSSPRRRIGQRRARSAIADPQACRWSSSSPFDAALHDAYGKAFRLSAYRDLRPRLHERGTCRTISGPKFKGEYLDRYLPSEPQPTMPVFHSVGASDPLEPADVKQRVDDGLPNTLEEWIRRDGLIPLQDQAERRQPAGRSRSRRPHRSRRQRACCRRVACATGSTSSTSTRAARTSPISSSSCARCARRRRTGFDRILYIEQPTARDLKKDRANVMHEAAKLCPIVATRR